MKLILILDLLLAHVYSRQNFDISTIWFLAALINVQVVGWLIYQLAIYPRFISPIRKIPEPENSHFLIGQSRNIFITPDIITARQWVNNTPNRGLIRFRTLWGIDSIVVTSPDLLSDVLVSNSYNFEKRPFMARIFALLLGNGIIFAEGVEHKVHRVNITAGTRLLLRLCQRQRKHLMPPFAFSQIKKLYPVFWRHAAISVTAIKNAIMESQELLGCAGHTCEKVEYTCNINDWASRVTLDIIGEAGMGQSFHAVDNPNNSLYRAYSTVFRQPVRQQAQSIIKRLFRDAILTRAPYFAQFFPVDGNNPTVKAVRLIRGACRDLIRNGKPIIEAKKDIEARPATTGIISTRQVAKENVLTAAIASDAFTDEELVNQVMTFLLAGHESSASALTMAIYYLCKHPEVQSRLRDEIRSQLPSPSTDAEFSADQIRSLPYLNAVSEEVMRLAPSVPISGRITVADTYIGDQFIPKGTTLILASAAINTSKEVWGEDALKFDPERWLTEGRIPKSPYANMTFLHGPRSCMGKDFAKGGFACVLAAWVGTFDFQFEDPNFEPKFAKTTLSLRVEGGLSVRVKAVQGW